MTENVKPGEQGNSLVHIQCGAHDQFTPIFPVYIQRFEPPGGLLSGEPEVPA